jgi:hypothetical protein
MSVSSSKRSNQSVKTTGSSSKTDKGPSIVDQRFEPVEYMPESIVASYQAVVDDMIANPKKFNESDQSEHWERLGVSQFYYGIFRQATTSLQNAFDLRKKLKYTRSSARIALMLGICHYRVGLLDLSLSTLETVIKNGVKTYPDIASRAYGNVALLHTINNKMKDAVDNAKKGLELILKVAKGNKSDERVLQVARILISIYLKVNDFQKAEVLSFTFKFPKYEQTLLKAGIKFAAGNIEDASDIIQIHLEEQQKEKEIDDDLLKQQQEQEKQKQKQKQKRIEINATADGDGDGDDTSVTSNITTDDKNNQRDDGSVEESHSYHSGLVTEETDLDDDDTIVTVDDRTQKQKWADEDKKILALNKLRETKEASESYTKYENNKKKLDQILVEAKLIFNLSVLASRQFVFKDAISKLDKAERTMEKYINTLQEQRSEAKRDDEEGMTQFFRDSKLNVTPLCETIDETSEPYIVLSHILYSKAETYLMISKEAKLTGIKVSRGKILNRGLPSVSNGNDFDIDDTIRSEVFANEYQDPNILKAQEFLNKSISILDNTNLSRDTFSFDIVKEIERDPSSEKKYDEDGVEILEEVQTEVVTTFLKSHDMSIAVAQKEYVDGYLDFTRGPTRYPSIKSGAMNSLKISYGVKLTERGTKGHQNSRVEYKNQYVSTYHDPVSIRSELLPLVTASGRTEIAMWVEWCLSASGGLGMGVFGTSFQMPVNKAALAKELADRASAELNSVSSNTNANSSIAGGGDEASVGSLGKSDNMFKSLKPSMTIGNKTAFPALKSGPRPTDAFLKEVRARLTEIEGILSSKYDQSESLYKPRDKELRILLNLCLARVNAQLKQKRDCELAIDMIEELSKDMRHRTQNKFDGHYIALAGRYRYELEESKVPAALSTEAHASKLVELLVYAKEYVTAAEKCVESPTEKQKKLDLGPDDTTALLLKRDAYKKCINIFLDLASTPDAEVKDKKKAPIQKEKGTLDMLKLYSEEEIEEKEEIGDIEWFQKFGKIRAQQIFVKMKALKEK